MELKEKVEDYLVNEVANYLEFVGAKPMLGRVFGLLISQTEPTSLTNIADRLKVSKPAISNTLQLGLQSGLFTKVYIPDSPREGFYTVTIDFLEMLVDPGLKKLTMLLEKMEKARQILIDEDYQKYESTTNLYNRLDHLVKAFYILLEEYKEFGDRIKDRIGKLKEAHK